jgi:hypothetical protein
MAEKIPGYAFKPLHGCLTSIFNLNRLLHLSMRGLGIISRRPWMVERIITLTKEAGKEVTEDMEVDLRSANEDAEFTNREIERGYPLLHAFTVVGYWSALESGVEDMLVGVMCNEPSVLEATSFAKIRVPLSKYEQLDKEERMRFLLSELQRNEASGSTQGVNTFENVLDIFGLNGEVDAPTKEGLWKLNNLRNTIVHRNSRADRRLVENCPSLNISIGDHVTVDHNTYESLTESVLNYILILMRRLGTRYDAPVPKRVIDFYPLSKPTQVGQPDN